MLTSVLQYSTLDFRFLEIQLKQLTKFSSEIIIPLCDKFFDGSDEDYQLILKSIEIISRYPKARIIHYNWEGEKENPAYYHNLSRAIGTDQSKFEWLLFLDADEIMEDSFGDWFDSIKYRNNAWVFDCYWYFREPIYRSKSIERAGILIKNRDCYWRLYDKLERHQLYQNLWEQNLLEITLPNSSPRIVDLKGNIMLHHYSWVRTKEQMLKKVTSWGHKNDKDWKSLVEEEFSREFNGRDFVHGYEYDIVENKFNL